MAPTLRSSLQLIPLPTAADCHRWCRQLLLIAAFTTPPIATDCRWYSRQLVPIATVDAAVITPPPAACWYSRQLAPTLRRWCRRYNAANNCYCLLPIAAVTTPPLMAPIATVDAASCCLLISPPIGAVITPLPIATDCRQLLLMPPPIAADAANCRRYNATVDCSQHCAAANCRLWLLLMPPL